MEAPTQKSGDLEVMGVSRSGRVRKKSSKLMDFQSPDDIETRHKRGAATKQQKYSSNYNTSTGGGGTNESSPQQQGHNAEQFFNIANVKEEELQIDDVQDFIQDADGGDNDESFDSDIDMGEIPIDDEAIIDDENDDDGGLDPTVRRSIYMTEKVNKKKVLKDGKIVYSKAQRKDKGKTRFTAYMLWAKDARKQISIQQTDLDFASVSRRLSEMWANVPKAEKVNWKRRAKRLANRITKPLPTSSSHQQQQQYTQQSMMQNMKDAMQQNLKSPTKFLNKGTGSNNSKSRKIPQIIENNQQQTNTLMECITPTSIINNLGGTQTHNNNNNNNNNNNINKISPITTPGIYKVTGIEPLDVAAHLKLLGDSLTIIGERLKEHEGQITVSGSLSVLLDSLLCSLAPLMCLTAQIHGLNSTTTAAATATATEKTDYNLKESLRKTLDNIAYVMPGL